MSHVKKFVLLALAGAALLAGCGTYRAPNPTPGPGTPNPPPTMPRY